MKEGCLTRPQIERQGKYPRYLTALLEKVSTIPGHTGCPNELGIHLNSVTAANQNIICLPLFYLWNVYLWNSTKYFNSHDNFIFKFVNILNTFYITVLCTLSNYQAKHDVHNSISHQGKASKQRKVTISRSSQSLLILRAVIATIFYTC